MEGGIALKEMLPFLSRYLGHQSTDDTFIITIRSAKLSDHQRQGQDFRFRYPGGETMSRKKRKRYCFSQKHWISLSITCLSSH